MTRSAARTALDGNNEVGVVDASLPKRLFNLLDAKSKERVLRLITTFRGSTLMEQEAFAQEVGATLAAEEQEKQGPGPLTSRLLSGPALQVRSRDCSYVALAEPKLQLNSASETVAMIKSLLKERPLVSARTEHAGDESEPHTECHSQSTAGALDDGAADANSQHEVSPPKEYRAVAVASVDGEERENDSQAPSVLFRTRGYQALRLARGEECLSGTEADTSTMRLVLNLTGMPLDEADLWEWFEILDVARNGTIGVVPFLQTIKNLDRGFGLTEKADQEFARDVEAIATDGQLTFEKFAYLVTRFLRQ
ncbi:hypothetical protein TraAM80_04114 [Trypanosoma rangeli]|uniref:Uncharacterized protein n=1 Tax=Trypanosoma rangeli TaxID=5698 RepID=A0A3R7NQI4_TRYRA|nr:uncharacterized protein TraAM80_04114 [Trypanosoma rangeli]RNF06137.1 hypothetical protein TraAM80_04114 [Trypanosoma rangeli]|eukprot:RNF06137.1 hypothetical protein TraAM80_04114 [Trypanosoma rangeli]